MNHKDRQININQYLLPNIWLTENILLKQSPGSSYTVLKSLTYCLAHGVGASLEKATCEMFSHILNNEHRNVGR